MKKIQSVKLERITAGNIEISPPLKYPGVPFFSLVRTESVKKMENWSQETTGQTINRID